MTESRRQYLSWQRLTLYALQSGTCAHCSRWLNPETMQLAHRIADSKENRRRYGKAVVDHWRAQALVCGELHAGVDCNAAMLVDGKPATAAALVAEIRASLDRERRGVEVVGG